MKSKKLIIKLKNYPMSLIQTKKIFTLCLVLIFKLSYAFNIHAGDLLFQDLNCGKFCDGVNVATFGYDHTYVSHVALAIDNQHVIEAIGKHVTITNLDSFLNRSKDDDGNPRVMVGRLTKNRELIPKAIKIAIQQVGKPYNSSFYPSNSSFYCSSLVTYAFNLASSKTVFPLIKMNFYDLQTKQIPSFWISYYKRLNKKMPQGIAGSNPGQLSRENFVKIIHYYGKLRRYNG